jgi:hypothetical protein
MGNKGLDITSLFNDDLQAEFCFDEENGVYVTIGYLSTEKAAKAIKTCTKKEKDKKSRQYVDVVDDLKATKAIAKHTLISWRGLIVNGEELPVTDDNRDKLFMKFNDLAEFVTEKATDFRDLIDKQKEEQRKNSSGMSG